jgi:transposase InsO family protein
MKVARGCGRSHRNWLREQFADCEITLSHGGTGQCWLNALAEASFVSIKGELLDLLESRRCIHLAAGA